MISGYSQNSVAAIGNANQIINKEFSMENNIQYYISNNAKNVYPYFEI
jgi:hypothetical protein